MGTKINLPSHVAQHVTHLVDQYRLLENKNNSALKKQILGELKKTAKQYGFSSVQDIHSAAKKSKSIISTSSFKSPQSESRIDSLRAQLDSDTEKALAPMRTRVKNSLSLLQEANALKLRLDIPDNLKSSECKAEYERLGSRFKSQLKGLMQDVDANSVKDLSLCIRSLKLRDETKGSLATECLQNIYDSQMAMKECKDRLVIGNKSSTLDQRRATGNMDKLRRTHENCAMSASHSQESSVVAQVREKLSSMIRVCISTHYKDGTIINALVKKECMQKTLDALQDDSRGCTISEKEQILKMTESSIDAIRNANTRSAEVTGYIYNTAMPQIEEAKKACGTIPPTTSIDDSSMNAQSCSHAARQQFGSNHPSQQNTRPSGCVR